MSLKSFVSQYAKAFDLTQRELEIVSLLVHRVTDPDEIAKELKISKNTVNNHLKNILLKTSTSSKSELLADFLLFLDGKKLRKLPVLQPRILIIDDESELVKILQEYFNAEGIENYCYSNPLEALADIRKLKIDVVITDIKMPGMNGMLFLEEIRKIHQYEPGVIFISGFAAEYNLEELLHRGAFALLEKPLNYERLKRLVWEYLLEKSPSLSKAESKEVELLQGIPNLSRLEIGFGGFFLPKESAALQAGQKIQVSFRLPTSQEPLEATCEVVWYREANQEDLRPGYGLKFLNISQHARNKVQEFVRMENILSFIPLGSKK